MSAVDVIHIIKNTSYIKRDDTHCLTENPLIEMFIREKLNLHLSGGGAAPLITQEIILCQSVMQQVKVVMLHRKDKRQFAATYTLPQM